jgi:hypothetical protein
MDFKLARDQKDDTGKVFRVRAHYVYWWIGKERSTPHDWERIVFSDLDNIFRNVNNRWGYPSVMVVVDPERENGDEEARERAFDWIRAHAPTFQKSLAKPPAAAAATASAP